MPDKRLLELAELTPQQAKAVLRCLNNGNQLVRGSLDCDGVPRVVLDNLRQKGLLKCFGPLFPTGVEYKLTETGMALAAALKARANREMGDG
jgi:hypothetical protein